MRVRRVPKLPWSHRGVEDLGRRVLGELRVLWLVLGRAGENRRVQGYDGADLVAAVGQGGSVGGEEPEGRYGQALIGHDERLKSKGDSGKVKR